MHKSRVKIQEHENKQQLNWGKSDFLPKYSWGKYNHKFPVFSVDF